MAVRLIPPGPGVPAGLQALLTSFYDAITDLQNPTAPVPFPSIDTKANLLLVDPSVYAKCGIVCDDINALCVSTLVAGTWIWLRADGSAL